MTGPIPGDEHTVVYRAVADFRELLAAVAKAKAELKALSGDTTSKAGAAGIAERLRRDVEAFTRARVDGANRAAVAEQLVTKARVDGARQVEQAVQKTIKAEQASLDLKKAAIEAEQRLAAIKERTAEAEARHAAQARELNNARSAVNRAQGALDKQQQALANRPTGPDAAQAAELQRLQQRLADATARATRAEQERDRTSATLRNARSTQTAAERFVDASNVQQIPIAASSTKRRPKPLGESQADIDAATKLAKAENDLADATERTATVTKRRRTKAEIDADKALVEAETALERARQHAEEAAARHQAAAKEFSSARSAQTRAQKAVSSAGDTERLQAAQARLAAADERIRAAETERDLTKPQLAEARAAARRAEADVVTARRAADRATATAERRAEARHAKTTAQTVVETPTPRESPANETVKAESAGADTADAVRRLQRMSIPQLREEAQRLGLAHLEGKRKDDLLAGLIAHTRQSTSTRPVSAPAAAVASASHSRADELPPAMQALLDDITEAYHERHTAQVSDRDVTRLGSGRVGGDRRVVEELTRSLREMHLQSANAGKELEALRRPVLGPAQGPQRFERSLDRAANSFLTLQERVDATGRELEIFRRPVHETNAATVAAHAATRRFEDGLTAVNGRLATQRAELDGFARKVGFFADRLGDNVPVLQQEFEALEHFRAGLNRVDAALHPQRPEDPRVAGSRNLATFAREVLAEVDRAGKQHEIASGPTGATASYWESLDRNVRHVNQAFESRSVERFNTGLDKVGEDLRQKFLADIRAVGEELRASLVGTAEEFDRFNEAIANVDHRLQSNFRARSPAVPRQTDQDILRRQDGGGAVAMRRDDLERFIQEVRQTREEPNFAPYEGRRTRQQEFVDAGREWRQFHAEGELFDDRPPYRPFRRQLTDGFDRHDTVFADATYPGSGPFTGAGRGAYDPNFGRSDGRSRVPHPDDFMNQMRDAQRYYATRALPAGLGRTEPKWYKNWLTGGKTRQRRPKQPLVNFDTYGRLRETQRDRSDSRTRRRGVRTFGNAARATADLFRPAARARTRNDLPAGAGRIEGLAKQFTDIGDLLPKLTASFGYWEKIIIAVVTALVVLIPALATVTAGLGALLSAAIAGGAALGVFAIAAVGSLARVKAAFDANAKSGAAIPAAYRPVITAFQALRGEYNRFLDATQQDVFGVFVKGLHVVSGLLPRFVPIVHAVANALSGVFGQVEAATKSDTFSRFLGFVGTQGAAAITKFASVLLTLGKGAAELAMAFGPYLGIVLDGLQKLADGFESFGAGASTSKSFKQFMDYAIASAPKVAEFFGQLFDALIKLVSALQPVGAQLFAVFTGLLKLFNAIPTNFLAGIIKGFVDLWLALRLFLGLTAIVKGFFTLLDGIRKFAQIAEVTALLKKFAAAFPALAAAMGVAEAGAISLRTALIGLAIGTGVIGLLTVAIGGLLGFLTDLATEQDTAADATQKHADAQQRLLQMLRANHGELSSQDRETLSDDLMSNRKTAAFDLSTGGKSRPLDFTISDEAKKAGVNLSDLVPGQAGDDAARTRVDRGFSNRLNDLQARRATLLGQRNTQLAGRQSTASTDAAIKGLDEEIAKAKEAQKAYDDAAVSGAKKQEILGDSAELTGDKVGGQTDKVVALKNAYLGLIAKQADDTTTTSVDNAIQAYDAYNDAVREQVRAKEAMAKANIDAARSVEDAQKRITSASQAVAEAQIAERDAQENLTKAREDAAAQLEDYRRTLRDIPLDEEQASINLQKAIEAERKSRAAPGATGLDRRQAVLDLKRAQNSYSDLITDDQRKRADAQRGIAQTPANLEDSEIVQKAKNALKDAQTSLAGANTELERAIQDYPFVKQAAKEAVDDAQRNFQVATEKVGETAKAMSDAAATAGVLVSQLADLKAQKDLIAGDIAMSITLEGGPETLDALRQIATYREAWRLMAANPGMSLPQALQQAGINVAANAADSGLTRQTSGGRGHSHDVPGNAEGGPIVGEGTGTSDSILRRLSNGEHVWTAAEVIAVGGHTMVQAIRAAALNRKHAAATPGMQAHTADLFRRAAVPGRTAPGTDPVQLSAAMFTAGLNVAAVTAPGLAPVSATARAVVVDNSVHHNGVSTGDITINNPVKEQAGGSLYRTIRRLRRDYD